MKLNAMFSPTKIGAVTIPNRFVVPPMGNNFAHRDGTLSHRSKLYYEERAKGGFGLITIEATVVDETAKGGHRKPCLFSDETIESFRKVAEGCHQYGAKVSVQLQHAGPEGNPEVTGRPLKAASAVFSKKNQPIPREITTEEIERVIECYGEAALRAKKAGIDMVELHCAHGYLLHSFLSLRTNKRMDEYGGCLENRMRLIRRIIERIQEKAGKEFPIICRINGTDDISGGLTVQDSTVIAMKLEEMGVSALHISRATHLRDDRLWATGMLHDGFSADLVAEIKRAVNIPVIAVGRFTEGEYGELLVRQNKADLIAFGRQSIADPHFPKKLQEEKPETIFPCIGCLQGCVPNMMAGQPITCLANPTVGKEAQSQFTAMQKKRIMVVGGGIAGLTAARICAVRGHTVTVLEQQEQLGGQMRAAAVPPGKGQISALLGAIQRDCETHGVTVHCNTTVTSEHLQKEQPDVILLATGAVPRQLHFPGKLTIDCVSATDVLFGKVVCGEKVLILGGGSVGCETAAFLAERQVSVTILERGQQLGTGLGTEHSRELEMLLSRYGVQAILNAEVHRFVNNGVLYRTKKGDDTILSGFNTIVLAVGSKSRNELLEAAQKFGVASYVIGDAVTPRNALDAVREGYHIAEKL